MAYKDPVVEKQKHKEWSHQHYLNNKEKYKESSQKSYPKFKRDRTRWLQEIKEETGCQRCGEKRGPCLCFHHVDPATKDFQASKTFYKLGKKRVIEEMKKCIVLCMNCHTLHHWEEANGSYEDFMAGRSG